MEQQYQRFKKTIPHLTRLKEDLCLIVSMCKETATIILNMTVNALPKNNNTNIQCSASLDIENDRSDPAWLIVIGPPDSDSLHLSNEMINATSVLVTWTTPYTPPENEILRYSIKVENGTTSMDIHFETVDAEETNVTYNLETLTNRRFRQAQRCDKFFTFTVTAHTLVGNSEAVTSRYFPIAPGQFRSQPEVSVTFSHDLRPTVRVWFQLPYMCPDQELQYTITIQNADLSTSLVVGPKNIIYTSEMIEEQITNGTLSGARYNLVVHLSTIAGDSTSDTVPFDTIIITTTASESEADDSRSSTFYLIVGIVAGAIIGALLLLIVTVTIVLICMHTRRNVSPSPYHLSFQHKIQSSS